MYQIQKVTKQTRGRQYTIINLIFNGFSIEMDMPVLAGIFAMNKSIANVCKLLHMYIILMPDKFCAPFL